MFDISNIALIVYDFDGVMTDNRVIVDSSGNEFVCVNRGDGYAISMFRKLKIPQIIISTETNSVVVKRAEKLQIPVINGVRNKKNVLEEYCANHQIDLKNVLYVGNDLNDYDVMVSVGYPCCPADAEIEIQRISIWRSLENGGCGVIRELYRVLMQEPDYE